MSSEVSAILDQLRQDHHNMNLLLDLIEQEAELAAQGHRFPLDFEAGEGAYPLFGDSREKEYPRVLSRIRSTYRGRAHARR